MEQCISDAVVAIMTGLSLALAGLIVTCTICVISVVKPHKKKE